MCLEITKNAIRQIAFEDIICYKQLIHTPDFTSYDGKSFTGRINGIECEGVIRVKDDYTLFQGWNPAFIKVRDNKSFKYRYGWEFDDYIQSIIVDGIELMTLTENSIFITPFQKVKVKIGETYTSELIRKYYNSSDAIDVGLHSFVHCDAIKISGDDCIVKCIIPKGAEYYKGRFNENDSYASTQLKYLEIIN